VDETKETFNFLREILDLKKLDSLIESGDHPEKWKLVVRLIRNRWFSRRWVIQELALAKNATVCWGAESMPWSEFADAIALFMTKHDDIKRILSKTTEYPRTTDHFTDARVLGANTLVNATNNLFRKSQDGEIQQRLLTLEVLVSCYLLAFEASDPRDTIYAVLSIAKDTSYANCDLTARTSWMIQKHQKSNSILGTFGAVIRNYCSQALLRLSLPPPVPTGEIPPPDPRIAPDYDKSLMDVCVDFMDYCIEASHSLDILCRHWAPPPREQTPQERLKRGGDSKEQEAMPSWIPSIKGYAFGTPEDALNGRLNGDSLVGSLERQNQQHYNASAGLWPFVNFGRLEESQDMQIEYPHISTQASPASSTPGVQKSAQPPRPISSKFNGTLYVKGFQLGEITKRSGRVADGVINQEALEMGGWPLNCSSSTVPDQLWRTLVADRGDNGINAPSWYHRACLECLSHTDQNGDLNTNKLKDYTGTPSTIVSFLNRVQRVIWNRNFFQSEDAKGRILFGLAPPKAKAHDIICIFFGCSVPVLLRPHNTPEGSIYFQFIGECYVHGYMDGEAIHPRKRPVLPYDDAPWFNLR
jgi:hypothetical protein